MAKKKIFVSFDYDNDKHYRNLLQAWDANPDFDFFFSDLTPGEIDTWDISKIKAALTRSINQATGTLVIVGKYANRKHKDSDEIGFTNWINFEIAKSKDNGNRLIAIKLNREYVSPSELFGSEATWAMSFNRDAIIKAIHEAYNK